MSQPAAVRNRLLAALPPDVLAALLPRLTPVAFPLRRVIQHADATIEAVHFPEAGMISLLTNLEDGTQSEVGVVGREGMIGLALLSGVDTSFTEAMVQLPGGGLRMAAAAFQRELEESPPFRALLMRYNEAFQGQVTQTATCNARHGLEQRLARWLLMAQDRSGDGTLPLTQEVIATMLGVHRPSITITAGILARAGMIRYAAGVITVLDRPALEAAACECYAAVQRRHAALLDPPRPAV